MKIETIKISNGKGGFILINKSDFDPTKHELFGSNIPDPGEKFFVGKSEYVRILTKSEAMAMNRDQLRDYAKQFEINGTSKEGFLKDLEAAGKLVETE